MTRDPVCAASGAGMRVGRDFPREMENGIESTAKTVVMNKLNGPAERVVGLVEKVTGKGGGGK